MPGLNEQQKYELRVDENKKLARMISEQVKQAFREVLEEYGFTKKTATKKEK